MLTANQIDVLRSHSEKLLDPVIDFLIEDIAKCVSEAGQLTSTAAYQVWRTQQLGMSQGQLKKEIAKRLKVSQADVAQLLTQAAETGYNFDISRFPTSHAVPLSANSSLQQILDATIKQAQDDLLNMTQTIGFIGPDGNVHELTQAYQQACDFAFQKVSTGAQDYVSAVREATRNLAKKGIRSIDYESGVHTSLEAAVRRNIMGGIGIMQGQISQQNHDYLGCNGWEISAHSGSAPDHEPIQGKQYTDEEYTRLNNSLVRRIGTLNCGHAEFPIILGVNSPQYTPEELENMRQENEKGITYEGKHYTLYEAGQRQRNLESAARDRKRMILIDEKLGDKDKLQNDQIRLQMIKQEYSRFSKAAGLPTQHARMETSGFDWKKGRAAENVVKTANAPAVAGEQSPRQKKKSSYAVDWDIVQSEKYVDRFANLSNNEKANKAVCTRARWALNNRDGVRTEELYALDMRTGKEIARITDQHFPQGVKRTRLFDKALKKAKDKGSDIILVHNHPVGSPPSVADLNALLSTPGAKGVVAGHDGSLYQYTSPKEKIPQSDFAVAILKYKSYTYNTAHEKALLDLSKQYGFEFTKL